MLILKVSAKLCQSFLTLCNPMDCSPPSSSVQGVLQARILEWLPFPSPGDLPRPGIKCTSPALTGRFFTTEPPGKPQIYAAAAAAVLLQSCPALCDPLDGSPLGSPSLGFSRQEHWSGLPFPSPMRESEVAQSCPTLSDPMDYSLPGSPIHGIFQAKYWSGVPLPSPKNRTER